MKITIPFKTPSVNHLWLQRGYHRFLTKEGKELKNKIKEIIDNIPLNIQSDFYNSAENSKLKVEILVYENWYTKKGELKRADVDNRTKFLIDAVFDALEMDDKYIFTLAVSKIQSTEEMSVISINAI